MYRIHNTPCYFEDGFGDVSDGIKDKIIYAMAEKYTDWDELINRKYKIMYNSFGEESGKTKLRDIISNEQVIFKHPKVSDSNYKFTAILGAQGCGNGYYYQSIGKFNVDI